MNPAALVMLIALLQICRGYTHFSLPKQSTYLRSSCIRNLTRRRKSPATPSPVLAYHSSSLSAIRDAGGESSNMPRGVKKENLPSKVCVVCGRPFTWRKKWERVWDEVTTCSKSCNRKRKMKGKEPGENGFVASVSALGESRVGNASMGGESITGSSVMAKPAEEETNLIDVEILAAQRLGSLDDPKHSPSDDSSSEHSQTTKSGTDVDMGLIPPILDAKALRKAEKKRKKAERRAQREGRGDPSAGQKQCTLCQKSVNLLIRCTYDESGEWGMVCGKCWNAASGGVVDGDDAHPHYRYGGFPRQNEHAPLVPPRDANVVVYVPRPQPPRGTHDPQRHVRVQRRIRDADPKPIELDVYLSPVAFVGVAFDVHRDEPPRLSAFAEKRRGIVRLERDDVAYIVPVEIYGLRAFDGIGILRPFAEDARALEAVLQLPRQDGIGPSRGVVAVRLIFQRVDERRERIDAPRPSAASPQAREVLGGPDQFPVSSQASQYVLVGGGTLALEDFHGVEDGPGQRGGRGLVRRDRGEEPEEGRLAFARFALGGGGGGGGVERIREEPSRRSKAASARSDRGECMSAKRREEAAGRTCRGGDDWRPPRSRRHLRHGSVAAATLRRCGEGKGKGRKGTGKSSGGRGTVGDVDDL
ncbi:hypothetical protein ACHAWF_014592 [Thalassiosira exigua]